MKIRTVLVALFLLSIVCPSMVSARGSSGGRSSSISRSSLSKSSTSSSKSSLSKSSATATRSKTSAARVKTANGKTGQGGYYPSFRGYTPPAGSTVVYRDTSAWDVLPWLYIMNASNHQTATVTQPDGKKVEVKDDGVDGMLIFNWILMLLLGIGLIVLIVWLVNKKTSRPKHSYGY